MATIRQQLRALLSQGTWTSLELSAELHVSEKDIFDHLEHLQKSLGTTLIATPYACQSCNYVFRKRRRLDRPGRCPRCRQSHIRMARFSLT